MNDNEKNSASVPYPSDMLHMYLLYCGTHRLVGLPPAKLGRVEPAQGGGRRPPRSPESEFNAQFSFVFDRISMIASPVNRFLVYPAHSLAPKNERSGH